MTYLFATNKTVTLDDGSKVSTTFYELIKNHVIGRYDSLDPQKMYDIDAILGEGLALVFNSAAVSKISQSFETMVENAEVPYVELKDEAEYCTHYQLMPSVLSL
jgi:hypothetical protein